MLKLIHFIILFDNRVNNCYIFLVSVKATLECTYIYNKHNLVCTVIFYFLFFSSITSIFYFAHAFKFNNYNSTK